MTQLILDKLQNKNVRRWLGVILALVLVVSLFPALHDAYGTNEEPRTEDIVLAEESAAEEEPAPSEDEQLSTDEESSPSDPEGDTSLGEEQEITTVSEENEEIETQASSYDNDVAALNAALANGNVNVGAQIRFTTAGSYELTVPEGKTLTATLYAGPGVNLTVLGKGTIDGGKKGSVIVKEGAGTLTIGNASAGPTIKNGTGSKLSRGYSDKEGTSSDNTIFFGNPDVGGGVLVKRDVSANGATLIFNNGTVTGNTAQAGGGVFVDRGCSFTMNNGTVTNNQTVRSASAVALAISGDARTDKNAAHEGGGIWTAAAGATINKGVITNNHANTVNDWGGGGIFVESKGTLSIPTSAVVTNNTADALGGGISGCPHAKTGIGSFGGTSAIAIYGNTAQGLSTAWPNNKYLNSSNGKGDGARGDYLAKNDAGFTADKAMDYYCTYVSYVSAQNYVSDASYSWKGRMVKKGEAGQDATIDPYKAGTIAGIAVQDASLGLTAAMPKNPAAANQSNYAVVITGNTSKTHGGGIGLNGTLTVGNIPNDEDVVDDRWSIELTKQYKKLDGSLASLKGGEFTFGAYKDEACTQPIMVKDAATGKDVALTATNDKDGKVSFTFNGYPVTGTENEKQTLYVKEIVPGDPSVNIDYDASVHKIEATVKKTVTSVNDPWTVTTTSYDAKVTGYYIKNDQGRWVAQDISKPLPAFVNEVQPTEADEFATNPWTLEFIKSFTSLNDQDLFDAEGTNLSSAGIPTTFNFDLYEATDRDAAIEDVYKENGQLDEEKLTRIATATNATSGDNKGQVKFEFVNDKGADEGINDRVDATNYRVEKDGSETYTFFAKETVADEDQHPAIDYDTVWHRAEVTVKTTKSERVDGKDTLTPVKVTVYASAREEVVYATEQQKDDGTFEFVVNGEEGKTFTNVYHPEGTFDLSALKRYFGMDAADATGKFGFTMTGVLAPEQQADGTLKLDLLNSPNDLGMYHANNGAFDPDGEAEVLFEDVTLTQEGDFWFMIAEDDCEGATIDSRIYVIKVAATVSSDGTILEPQIVEAYYAEGITLEEGGFLKPEQRYLDLKPLKAEQQEDGTSSFPIEFANFSNEMATMSLSGYAVNAASNEPIERECFVDPKIIKNLDGRSLTEGEFNFKLIELTPDSDGNVDWSVQQGPVISETANDRYGMVDFDKANNVSGDWENPSCLAYTAPGTYYYRVVEANDTTDITVEYSTEIITFTTVIELNDEGQLECTDMYYGHVENGENVRYSESEDPQWHPTMTNYAKGMDLQVRKTSALDRDQGLEGATYGLYAVNTGAQADILMGEATSDADGWITFENVNLKEGTLYYFKEREAPAGHTVSEFRSGFFYVVKDASAPNGYVMHYTDDKAELGTPETDELELATQAEGEPVALDESTPAGPTSDNGKMLFTYERDGGVYDEATLTEFAKLDTRTHEWVEGADLSIIDKATGKTVNRWTSGKANERLEGKLNVDTVYILRENTAPEGYAKAADVEFKIDSYGNVEIISGTSNGNAELQGTTITLYDTMLDGEEVVTEYREVPGDNDEGGFLAKTADFLKAGGIVAVALLAVVALLFAIRRARSNGRDLE